MLNSNFKMNFVVSCNICLRNEKVKKILIMLSCNNITNVNSRYYYLFKISPKMPLAGLKVEYSGKTFFNFKTQMYCACAETYGVGICCTSMLCFKRYFRLSKCAKS